MQSFFDEKCGNSKTIVRDYPLLDRVRLFGRGIKIVNAADSE